LQLPVLDEMPIVTMRLSSVNGQSIKSILADKDTRHSRWAFRREYRSTYGDHLRPGERIIAGTFVSSVTNDVSIVPVSLEEGIAKELGVHLGDELVFDIQGVPITTRVASLRTVEWRRIQPNFFVLFPRGALEQAPAMHVLVTRVSSSEQSARMQRALVTAFPNISVIDLTLVLRTLDSILGKISFVVRFMALFTVATGLIILVSTLAVTRHLRLQESVLLRVLGASRAQVLKIMVVEYFSLGFLGTLSGVLLAVVAAWALALFVFKIPFALAPAPPLIALLAVPALTILIGLLITRGVLTQPPLAILRTEA
jgi:putative ABC transport system permease protein